MCCEYRIFVNRRFFFFYQDKKEKKERPLASWLCVRRLFFRFVGIGGGAGESILLILKKKKYGESALIQASSKGHLQIVNRLLKFPRININIQSNVIYIYIYIYIYKHNKIYIKLWLFTNNSSLSLVHGCYKKLCFRFPSFFFLTRELSFFNFSSSLLLQKAPSRPFPLSHLPPPSEQLQINKKIAVVKD